MRKLDLLKKKIDIFFEFAKKRNLRDEKDGVVHKAVQEYYLTRDMKSLRAVDRHFFMYTVPMRLGPERMQQLNRLLASSGVMQKQKSRHLLEGQKEKLEHLRRKWQIFYDLIVAEGLAQQADHELSDLFKRAYVIGDLGAMKATIADVVLQLNERFQDSVVHEVHRRWHEELGDPTYERCEKRDRDRVERLIAKGKVTALRDAEFLQDWMESHANDESLSRPVLLAGKLLFEYNPRKPKRRGPDA